MLPYIIMDLSHDGLYDLKDLNILLKNWESTKTDGVSFVKRHWGRGFTLFSGRVIQTGGYVKNAVIKIN